MNKKDISHSALTLIFWMFASLGLMQHTKVYGTPEMLQFFSDINTFFDSDVLFSTILYSFLVGMAVAFVAVRFIVHRRMLLAGLVLPIVGIITAYIFMNLELKTYLLYSAAVVGFGFGLLPISSVCAVMKMLTVRIRSNTNQVFYVLAAPSRSRAIEDHDEHVEAEAQFSDGDESHVQIEEPPAPTSRSRVLTPIGVYLSLPVLAGIAILSRHLLGVIISIVVLFAGVFMLLYRSKKFGNFTNRPSVRIIARTVFTNYMFYMLIALYAIASCVDIVSLYYTLFILKDFLGDIDQVQFIPLVMLLLFVARLTMILFAELSLVRVPARRLVLFSYLAIGIGMVVLALTTEKSNKILLLFAISSSLSVVFPSVVKGFARFTPFVVLPFVLLCISLVGTVIMVVLYTNVFEYLRDINSFNLFYLIAAVTGIVMAALFFVLSYKRSTV